MSAATNEKEVIAWTAHPAAKRPGMTLLGCAIITLLGAAAWWSFGGAWAAGSVIVLFVSLNRFFLPSRFVIDAEGMRAKYAFRTQHMKWPDVRRFVSDARGGYLSTRAVGSRLDAFRGMHVLFPVDRDHIVQAIKSRMSQRSANALANAMIAVVGGGA